MKQEKRFLSDSDTNGIDGFWVDSEPDNMRTVDEVEQHYQEVIQRMESSIDQNAIQDRLNKAHAIGFKDGAKATELIMNKKIDALNDLIDETMCILYNQNNGRSEAIKLIEAFKEGKNV